MKITYSSPSCNPSDALGRINRYVQAQRVPGEVVAAEEISPGAKLLFARIWNLTHRGAEPCRRCLTFLARDLNASQSVVSRWYAELEAAGLVTRTQRHSSTSGKTWIETRVVTTHPWLDGDAVYIPEHVIGHVSPRASLVAAELLYDCGAWGVARSTWASIASRVGMTVRQVGIAVEELIKGGFVAAWGNIKRGCGYVYAFLLNDQTRRHARPEASEVGIEIGPDDFHGLDLPPWYEVAAAVPGPEPESTEGETGTGEGSDCETGFQEDTKEEPEGLVTPQQVPQSLANASASPPPHWVTPEQPYTECPGVQSEEDLQSKRASAHDDTSIEFSSCSFPSNQKEGIFTPDSTDDFTVGVAYPPLPPSRPGNRNSSTDMAGDSAELGPARVTVGDVEDVVGAFVAAAEAEVGETLPLTRADRWAARWLVSWYGVDRAKVIAVSAAVWWSGIDHVLGFHRAPNLGVFFGKPWLSVQLVLWLRLMESAAEVTEGRPGALVRWSEVRRQFLQGGGAVFDLSMLDMIRRYDLAAAGRETGFQGDSSGQSENKVQGDKVRRTSGKKVTKAMVVEAGAATASARERSDSKRKISRPADHLHAVWTEELFARYGDDLTVVSWTGAEISLAKKLAAELGTDKAEAVVRRFVKDWWGEDVPVFKFCWVRRQATIGKVEGKAGQRMTRGQREILESEYDAEKEKQAKGKTLFDILQEAICQHGA